MKKLFTIGLCLSFAILSAAAPKVGFKSSEAHDEGRQFLELLDQKARFPENDWEKNKFSRYIHSGSLGHEVAIYGIEGKERQDQILEIAQAIVNTGEFHWVHFSFYDEEKWKKTSERTRQRVGEILLRSETLKAEPVGTGQPM
jgi:hypothetical protein